ncbi:Wzz/FepE/Etk N-terminal domain-containing protein [Novosphingobium resinovorum]|uniref:GumC family protein n=1 Tax=Sphingomonadaceae TaxID=41297 RepID=UPI00027CBF3F|nr:MULTISPECIES: Wzz/FepE/Etk N-terminal domain-containing protein [Sphingomonadaceae]EJU14361.1 lipopolysaccharide biosynthesis protein [Sphingomonas sp. LH128]MBF7010011.1 lipopolysaccharide biosynthesis protein [Novosphingobium sp. HR1a]WJM28034.1 Wzz/FepE/Etk N-terminal domain-containing protein [Novosphingobium resinovorum]
MNSTTQTSAPVSPPASIVGDTDSLGIYPVEILAMLRRRWRWLIAPTLLGAAAAAGSVVMREPVYRSYATLLIDSPQIPQSLISSPITEVADERIAKIRQQIVSRDSLTRLIEQNRLYPSERAAMDYPKLLEIMRTKIGVNLVAANQAQGRGGTIAFNLTFDYRDARTAQAVTEQLTKMFLVEDKRFRTEQATGTAAFLAKRSDELRRQLRDLAEKRRGVQARYAGSLPTDVALSSQSSSAMRAEISRTDAETQGLVQQSSLLAARQQELERTPPGIEGMQRAEERLSALLSTHSENFPDVIAARAEVARQRALVAREPGRGETLIEAEIAAGRERISTLAARRAELVRTMADIDARVAQAPQSAYELNTIEREYDNIKRQYDSLREKQLDAQVAANLQSEDKGERFTVVDAPNLPLHPLGQKGWMVVLMGIAAGFVMGLVLIIGREMLTGTIHGTESLRRAVRAPLFGAVATSRTPTFLDRLARWLPGRAHAAAYSPA